MLLHRRETDAAIAEHHRGDAMPARRRQQRVPHRLAVVMGVHVDPAGRDHEAGGVDVAPGRALLAADRRDAAARDRHVAGESRLAGAIDDGAAANDDVVHGSRSWLRPGNDASRAIPVQCPCDRVTRSPAPHRFAELRPAPDRRHRAPGLPKAHQATAVAVEVAFTAKLFARQAGQRVLHHPHVAAVLNGADAVPHLRKPALGPGAGALRIGRTVQSHGRAAAGGGEMGHRRIGADIDRGAGEQGGKARPIERAALADHLERAEDAFDIGLLGGVAPLGHDDRELAFGKSARERAPAIIGPSPVALERRRMQHCIWRARRDRFSRRSLRAHRRNERQAKRVGQELHFLEAMAIVADRDRPVEHEDASTRFRRDAAARVRPGGATP